MSKDITFPWFSNSINSCVPQGFINIDQFNQVTKSPKHPETFAEIQAAKAAGDLKRTAELKAHLYYFNPAVHLRNWRNSKNILWFTGLCPVDFDKMTPEQAIEFKAYLFNHYRFFFSVYLSASRHGVRGLIRIPVVKSIPEYKAYFWAICQELGQYGYHFDTQLQTPVQPMYQSYDPDILHRPDPELWDIMAEPPVKSKPARTKETTPSELRTNTPNGQYSPLQIESAGKIIHKIAGTMFNRITDIGHPNVVKIGLIMGGYAGEGLITQNEAVNIMDAGITMHPYLKQKGDTYKITARWAVYEGIDAPLKLITTSTTTRPSNNQIVNFLKA
ncbi:MAG: hypothetical protein NT040_18130 [Bacteroidetes bacterium]|nr:hypothetical protein [Bacteroidota bacterium]